MPCVLTWLAGQNLNPRFRVRTLFTVFLFLFGAAVARAEKVPMELQGVGVDEHLGSKINLELGFTDDSGKPVQLKKYFNGSKPVLFFLVYYECPNLCTFVLNAAVDSIKNLNLLPGKDFEMVAVSIDPKETPDLAAKKKNAYLKSYGNLSTENGWHFLVGKQAPITELSNQLGFKYKWDKEQKQFAHASSIFVLTGDGKISRYFYGILYPERDMRVALVEAGRGHIGNIVDKILLFCFHYDASTKKYVLMATRIMTAGGGLTVLILGLFLAISFRKEKAAHA
jgi:protein SCO1/2